jgi:hypothetical protein
VISGRGSSEGEIPLAALANIYLHDFAWGGDWIGFRRNPATERH